MLRVAGYARWREHHPGAYFATDGRGAAIRALGLHTEPEVAHVAASGLVTALGGKDLNSSISRSGPDAARPWKEPYLLAAARLDGGGYVGLPAEARLSRGLGQATETIARLEGGRDWDRRTHASALAIVGDAQSVSVARVGTGRILVLTEGRCTEMGVSGAFGALADDSLVACFNEVPVTARVPLRRDDVFVLCHDVPPSGVHDRLIELDVRSPVDPAALARALVEEGAGQDAVVVVGVVAAPPAG